MGWSLVPEVPGDHSCGHLSFTVFNYVTYRLPFAEVTYRSHVRNGNVKKSRYKLKSWSYRSITVSNGKNEKYYRFGITVFNEPIQNYSNYRLQF